MVCGFLNLSIYLLMVYLLQVCLFTNANMSQIRDKKGHKKGIETKNPINTKSVQLIELHAFACYLVCIYLSESFDFLENI